MQTRTRIVLESLDSVEWFRTVGRKIDDLPVTQVDSWMAAIAACASGRWEIINFEMLQQFTFKLHNLHTERYQSWNTILEELQPASESLVDKKTKNVIQKHGLPRVFAERVKWNITMLLMEIEYSDVVPAGFFTDLSVFYTMGHFPCGWDGPWPPNGRIILF